MSLSLRCGLLLRADWFFCQARPAAVTGAVVKVKPVDASFYLFPSAKFPVTFLQYGIEVSAEGLLHGGQTQWPAGPKWAARRKVHVTLKKYLSTVNVEIRVQLFCDITSIQSGLGTGTGRTGVRFSHFFRNLVPVRFYSAA